MSRRTRRASTAPVSIPHEGPRPPRLLRGATRSRSLRVSPDTIAADRSRGRPRRDPRGPRRARFGQSSLALHRILDGRDPRRATSSRWRTRCSTDAGPASTSRPSAATRGEKVPVCLYRIGRRRRGRALSRGTSSNADRPRDGDPTASLFVSSRQDGIGLPRRRRQARDRRGGGRAGDGDWDRLRPGRRRSLRRRPARHDLPHRAATASRASFCRLEPSVSAYHLAFDTRGGPVS